MFFIFFSLSKYYVFSVIYMFLLFCFIGNDFWCDQLRFDHSRYGEASQIEWQSHRPALGLSSTGCTQDRGQLRNQTKFMFYYDFVFFFVQKSNLFFIFSEMRQRCYPHRTDTHKNNQVYPLLLCVWSLSAQRKENSNGDDDDVTFSINGKNNGNYYLCL